jgi:hypothetical protein
MHYVLRCQALVLNNRTASPRRRRGGWPATTPPTRCLNEHAAQGGMLRPASGRKTAATTLAIEIRYGSNTGPSMGCASTVAFRTAPRSCSRSDDYRSLGSSTQRRSFMAVLLMQRYCSGWTRSYLRSPVGSAKPSSRSPPAMGRSSVVGCNSPS